MSTIINLRKNSLIGKRELIVIIAAIVLTTVGIKASDFYFNSEGKLSENGCPDEMVYVTSDAGGFCIDKYEASIGDKCAYQEITNQSESRINLAGEECQPESLPGKKPWRFISQDQAALACAKAGKRLPNNKEWLASALGTPDKNETWNENDCQVNSNWNLQPGLTGSGQNCKSSAGAYDMVGNVWEWVAGSVNDGEFNNRLLPPAGYIDSLDGESMPGLTNPDMPNPDYNNDYLWIKNSGLRSIARGGNWSNESSAGEYSLYIVTAPSSAEPGIGFRCVK